jgi:hypothetical protein
MGLLGSLRDVALHTDRLDRLAGPLDVIAEILTGGGKATIYSFRLLSGGALLMAGRAGVFFP